MESVFLPKDKPLKSAGLVPVYYWFVRSLPFEKLVLARAFLSWFEMNRKTLSDDRFVMFSHYNRSTNDEKSFVERVGILGNLFEEWDEDPLK